MLISQHPSMKWCRLGYVSGRLAKGQQDRRRVTRENWGMEEQDRVAWDRESAGGWRDPRKGKEGQDNGLGFDRRGKRRREEGRRWSSGSEKLQARGKKHEYRASHTTCGVTASRGRPQVARVGGWGGRRNRRGLRGGHATPRVWDWGSRREGGLKSIQTQVARDGRESG